jgi:hypothetical protein
MSEGWVIIMVPSSRSMLSKKEETSLTVEGGISASTMRAAVGLETATAAPHGREAISPRDHFSQSIEVRFQ